MAIVFLYFYVSIVQVVNVHFHYMLLFHRSVQLNIDLYDFSLSLYSSVNFSFNFSTYLLSVRLVVIIGKLIKLCPSELSSM